MKTLIGRSWVYVHLAADGSVLYVGLTYDPQKREAHHVQKAPWWSLVHDIRYFGPYPEDSARRLERHVIELFDPPHNLIYTTRWEWHPNNREVGAA